MRPNRWIKLLLALLAMQILWGAMRIPTKVYGKRLKLIRHYQDAGAVAYHLDNDHRQGAAEISHILEQTDANSILLWRGDWRGSLEFVPALIMPRLLVQEATCAASTDELFGRPIATGQLADGRSGVLVLVGYKDHLELELR